MIWVFIVLGAAAVFAIAAVAVGREAFRLGHQPPPTIFDLDEAVDYVADRLPDDSQARLTYPEVRELVQAELGHLRNQGVFGLPGEEPAVALPSTNGDGRVVVVDDETLAVVLGWAESQGMEITDQDVFLVVSSLHDYLTEIGAIGPQA